MPPLSAPWNPQFSVTLEEAGGKAYSVSMTLRVKEEAEDKEANLVSLKPAPFSE